MREYAHIAMAKAASCSERVRASIIEGDGLDGGRCDVCVDDGQGSL